MHDTRMRSPRNTEEEEVFIEKAAAGPKDHVMLERKSAAELIKGALFFVVFFAASCGFTASQELIVSTPGFKPLHRGFLTLCHSASYCCFAGLELFRDGWSPAKRTTPLRDYAIVAVFCFLSVFLANASLGYIQYSTRVMVKCLKPLPTMALSRIMLGRERAAYGVWEYVGALVLGLGLATATLDGADFSGGEASLRLVLGASLAGLAILCDSFVSTFEQCTIFSRETRPPPAELVLYTYAMAAFQSFLVFVSSDEPQHAYTFFSANPTLLAKMFCSEIFGYASISMVVRLVAHYGATNAEVAKTARKGVVLFFSLVVIEGQAIKAAQVRGALVFLVGTAVFVEAKRRRKQRSRPRLYQQVSTEGLV